MSDGAIATILRAAAFASEKHSKQRRKDADASPYINHPLGLANILANEGDVTEVSVLAAALLHDTVEDTETTIEEIEENFGSDIAKIVAEVNGRQEPLEGGTEAASGSEVSVEI